MRRLSFFRALIYLRESILLGIVMSTITKLRSVHVADMAVFDWIATGIGAVALAKVIGTEHVAGVFVMLVIGAILIHKVMGIPTMFNAYLGLAKKDDVYAARKHATDQSPS